MRDWDFQLILDRTLIESDIQPFADLGEDLGNPANGSLIPTFDGSGPSEVYCYTPGITLLDAAFRAAAAVYQHTGAHAVRIEVDEENRDDLQGLARVA